MQRGLAPILIVLLVAVLGIGGYFIFTNYSNNRTKIISIPDTPATISTSKTSPTGLFTIEEKVLADHKTITIKDAQGNIVVEDIIQQNYDTVWSNMRKLGLTGGGQTGFSFKEWTNDNVFLLHINVANGWEFETLVDAKTGKLGESTFKRVK